MKKHVTLIAILFCSLFAFSQTTEELKNIKVASSKAIYLGKTPRIVDLAKLPSMSAEKKSLYKLQKQVPPNFIGRGKSKVVKPELEHQGVDPIWQKSGKSRVQITTLSPKVNVDGLFNSFGSPHDPTGSVGLDYYVQSINATEIGVFEKNGTLVTTFTGNSLWAPLGEASRGDPIVMFDHQFNRWIITEFADPANLLIGVTATSDPLGEYYVYSFSTPNFPDYPKWSIWGSYIAVTTNEEGPGALHQYFFDRDGLINGAEDVVMQRVTINGNTDTEAGFYVTTPVHWNGTNQPVEDKPIALKINDSSWGEVTDDVVEVFTFDIDLAEPANTTVTKTSIVTTPFDSYPCDAETGGFACLSQGSSNGIDAIPELIMNIPHYWNFGTHESMVFNFITDVANGANRSGIRWVELRRTSGNDWTLYQEGTYAPDDGLHRFMGSIAMDKDGNMGMAYNVSGPSTNAGIRFTGRLAEDPLGEMTFDEQVVIDGTNFVNTHRFGDYPHMTLDPIDGRTFWYTSEYGGNGSDNSKTRILAFQVERNTNDIEITTISNPTTSADLTNAESVTVTYTNNGSEDASNFDLQLLLDGATVETFNVAGPFLSGESDTHTFANTVDMSSLGTYEITVNVIFTSDEIDGNDSKTIEVRKLAGLDGAIVFDEVEPTCAEDHTELITLTNNGGTEITAATFDVSVNGTFQETVNWTGSLATDESTTVGIQFDGLSDGTNTISVTLTTVNGSADELTSDNTIESDITFDASKGQVTFNLLTDDWPGETTWEIRETETGDLVTSGGPYAEQNTNYEEKICLPESVCYTFTIFDSASDGICCGFGNGSYNLVDASGSILVSGGEFSASEATQFCVGFVCELTVGISQTNASRDMQGSITITADGGEGYQYSIDGGVTFGTESIFNNLDAGTYEVVVTSDDGQCIYEKPVTIQYILAIGDELIDGLNIGPNPTTGLFHISMSGHDYIDGFLRVQLIDLNGRVIQERRMSRYNDIFEGDLSLYAYPNGIYFIKFPDIKSNKLVKVIKQ